MSVGIQCSLAIDEETVRMPMHTFGAATDIARLIGQIRS